MFARALAHVAASRLPVHAANPLLVKVAWADAGEVLAEDVVIVGSELLHVVTARLRVLSSFVVVVGSLVFHVRLINSVGMLLILQ